MCLCLHCNLPTYNDNDPFCCTGCSAAYKVIKSLKLSNFYKYCQEIYNTHPTTANQFENKLSYEDHLSSAEDGKIHDINLIVEGLQCGACVWLIENTLRKQKNVTTARINLSTKRLSFKFSGKSTDIHHLVGIVSSLGYKLIPFTPDAAEAAERQYESLLLKSLIISGFAFVAMMMILWGVWAGIDDRSMRSPEIVIFNLIATVIAVPSIAFSSRIFLSSAYRALKAKRSNMDVAISVAIILTTLVSIQEAFLGGIYVYYDASVTLIFFLLAGRYLDHAVRAKARRHAQSLILSQPKVITLERNGTLCLVPIQDAKIGEIALVNAGEKFAADGVIIEGATEVNNSMITGESLPIEAVVGDIVMSGAINAGNSVRIKITALGEQSTLAEIIRLIDNAESGSSKYSRIADRLASIYTPSILTLSSLTGMAWFFVLGASWNVALFHGISVLIITCPCALGLAVPMVQVVANASLFKKGIVVKSADALERLALINHVVFDKTGTLTTTHPILINRDEINDDAFNVIASIASFSNHPLCKSIATRTPLRFDTTPEEIKGMGVNAILDGKAMKLGNKRFCEIYIPDTDDTFTEIWFQEDNHTPIRLCFENILRPDAAHVIEYIAKLQVPIEILSGDRVTVVAKCAQTIGITEYRATVTPQEKLYAIDALEESGSKTLMIGDGINDAAALKRAFVSISPTSSTAITQVNADIVFQGDSLRPVQKVLEAAHSSKRLILENFAISGVYNALTIPIAIMGLATPAIAAIVMSTSSILVALNSLRMK